jgi:hypothetical protein
LRKGEQVGRTRAAKTRRNKLSYEKRKSKRREAKLAYEAKEIARRGGCCELCRRIKPEYHWHHIHPAKRLFKVSTGRKDNTVDLATFRKEVSKCLYVCLDCHINIHRVR